MIGLDINNALRLLIIVVGLGWAIYEIVQFVRRRKAATPLTNEEFKEDIRKAQVIDVREKDEFKRKHILGARSLPYSQFKQRMNELRKDQPIYLYEENKMLSLRAGLKLKENGFEDIYYLKDGFSNWDGRTKSDKLDN